MSSLDTLFKPNSIAVIGASQKPNRAGNVVMKNLLTGGFLGTIMPVHPRYPSVNGVYCYKSIDNLPLTPDIAILCTNASRNVAIFQQLAVRGIKVAIVMAADMSDHHDESKTIEQRCMEIAKEHSIRVLGPNSLGVVLPWLNFNASFSPVTAKPGKLAFISQSSAVCTTVLDWANEKDIGFSAFLSLGNGTDIDFDDVLDYLSRDSKTESILLYIDSIRDARRFISAARAAARNRRILVLKAGRSRSTLASWMDEKHQTLDIVYDSAIQRSGMLRVNNTHELFAAVETLTHSVPLRGERLAIMTNGGGPANMALDTLMDKGGKLANLSQDVLDKLNAILPSTWSQCNPIDMVGDATSERYQKVLDILLDSDDIDAILVMHSPSSVAPQVETANAILDTIKSNKRSSRFNILTNWSGESTAKQARLRFTQASIPTYRTPESAVTAFMHLVEYRRNQWQLMETPTTTETIKPKQLHDAKSWIDGALQAHHQSDCKSVLLDTHQSHTLFDLFGLNTLPTWLASNDDDAVKIADTISYPVAIKLRSPDILHKSDVQGVMLNLRDQTEVRNATNAILERTQLSYPNARIEGVLVQAMAKVAGGQEIRLKVQVDPTFGPVIFIGQGGSEWELSKESTSALLPLNMALARYLLIRAITKGTVRFQKTPNPVNLNALAELIVKVSQMIVACPEIIEVDLHPLLINGNELTVIDASVCLAPFKGDAQRRLAIRPYPSELEQVTQLKDGTKLLIRPIKPEDEPFHAEFIKHVTKEDLYKRFFSDVGEFNHEALANLTQIDYDREMAFVAIDLAYEQPHIIGVSRVLVTPDNSDAEFAILIRSDLKGVGLGKLLMNEIIGYCQNKGTKQISGMTMPTNRGMLTLAQKLGFELDVQFEDGVADMVLTLSRS